jgi:hypothetical protein
MFVFLFVGFVLIIIIITSIERVIEGEPYFILLSLFHLLQDNRGLKYYVFLASF